MPTRTSTSTSTSQVNDKAVLEIQKLYEAAKAMYAPGGKFMAGTEAGIERGRKKAVASGMSGLASAGLAGTSMMGGLGLKYEEDVAAPTRARATSARVGALAGIMQSQAGAYAQLAPRTTTQQTTTPYAQQYGMPSKPAGATPQPSLQIYQPPTAPVQMGTALDRRKREAGKKSKSAGLPSSSYLAKPKTSDPAGTWQGTIGGTSFYSSGLGGYTQR